MIGRTIYVVYGALLLALVGTAEYRGWGFTRPTEVRNVPRTVRENPGVYRTHYRGGGRYYRGK